MAAASSGTAIVSLPTDQQILITREFDASRDLVYKAWTTPELVSRWWPGRRGTMTAAEIDLRVGGAWRYAMISTAGFDVAFHGEYLEILPTERIVMTEVYEAMPGSEALVTVTFTEHDGRTTVSLLMTLPSREIRDAVVASGMEGGVQEGWDLLEEIAGSL